jgi:hypothetical protein
VKFFSEKEGKACRIQWIEDSYYSIISVYGEAKGTDFIVVWFLSRAVADVRHLLIPLQIFGAKKKRNQNWKTKKIIWQLLIPKILIIFKNSTIFISVYRTKTQKGICKKCSSMN